MASSIDVVALGRSADTTAQSAIRSLTWNTWNLCSAHTEPGQLALKLRSADRKRNLWLAAAIISGTVLATTAITFTIGLAATLASCAVAPTQAVYLLIYLPKAVTVGIAILKATSAVVTIGALGALICFPLFTILSSTLNAYREQSCAKKHNAYLAESTSPECDYVARLNDQNYKMIGWIWDIDLNGSPVKCRVFAPIEGHSFKTTVTFTVEGDWNTQPYITARNDGADVVTYTVDEQTATAIFLKSTLHSDDNKRTLLSRLKEQLIARDQAARPTEEAI